MRSTFVLFIALAVVAMSESLRPVPKVLKSPVYKFDLCGTWRTKCDLSNRQDVVLKVIGNHGLMGKQFEITYNYYTGTYCDDSAFSYAERYVLDYVSETKEEDGSVEITTKTTGGYVRLSSSRFSGNIVTCESNEFADGEFYDVTALAGCTSGSVDPFQSMREEVESSGERYIKLMITDNQDELEIEGMQVESRESSEGCKGVTFTMNIVIIVVVIVVIIVIVLVVLCFMKAIKESNLPVEEEPSVPAPVEAKKETATVTVAPEAANTPAPEPAAAPAPVAEPTPAAAPAPEPTPVVVAAAEPAAPAAEPTPVVVVSEPAPAPEPTPAPTNPSSLL